MKILIVGLGNQGKKRINHLNKKNFFASYDPFNNEANYQNLNQIPIEKFDSVFLCIPDNQKYELSKYFLSIGKNTFIEKPLDLTIKEINFLYQLANKKKCILYTAYNHRFEPNILKIKYDFQNFNKNKIYFAKLFYGNGTAFDVKKSKWKDQNIGVITDLIPHLLDTLFFTLGYEKISNLKLHKISTFENKSPDHAILSFLFLDIFVEMEVSLCSWKNNFKYDIYTSKFSTHLESLNKWGNSSYSKFIRKFPS